MRSGASGERSPSREAHWLPECTPTCHPTSFHSVIVPLHNLPPPLQPLSQSRRCVGWFAGRTSSIMGPAPGHRCCDLDQCSWEGPPPPLRVCCPADMRRPWRPNKGRRSLPTRCHWRQWYPMARARGDHFSQPRDFLAWFHATSRAWQAFCFISLDPFGQGRVLEPVRGGITQMTGLAAGGSDASGEQNEAAI